MQQDLERLYQRTIHGIKLDLEPVRALLDDLGRPQDAFGAVHVAGTNGKGSVCALIESVLRWAGHRTGLYTSPHLVHFNERIRVDGVPIAEAELALLLRDIEASDERVARQPGLRAATFFECSTAMALTAFQRDGVDLAVLETGLGGRLDATNIVDPLITVITRIDIDHAHYLGKTTREVATEKAGIIKAGRPVVCGEMPADALEVIRATAAERRAAVSYVPETVSVRRLSRSLDGQKLKIETAGRSLPPTLLPLLGRHQIENCATAVAALEALEQVIGEEFPADVLTAGLAQVVWPARCQVLSSDPLTILDSAHNPGGARALLEALNEFAGERPVGLVAGFSEGKDHAAMLKVLAPRVTQCWLVPLKNPRGMSEGELAEGARWAGLDASFCAHEAALGEAKEWAATVGGLVCIAGSIYLAGEVLELLGRPVFE